MDLHKIKNVSKVFLLLFVFSCAEEDESPSAPTEGTVTFFATSDLGVGNVTVYVENQIVGNISRYYPGGVTCGSSDVNVQKDDGTYAWSASGATGTTWNGTIYIEGGKCETIELTNTGSSGGNNNPPTMTAPITLFVAAQDYSVNDFGGYWVEEFTISSNTNFVFRFTTKYNAQAGIIAPNQLNNFKNNQAFTGYGVFNNQLGTKSVILSAGTYYVAVRNTSNSANKWSLELDYVIALPASNKATFFDNYVSDTKSFSNSTKFWQPFSIQSGYRYFLDGCSVNCDLHIIQENQLAAFQNGQQYNYYSDYYDVGGGAPGLYEVTLPAGNYYLVSSNSENAALTYTMERWKINP